MSDTSPTLHALLSCLQATTKLLEDTQERHHQLSAMILQHTQDTAERLQDLLAQQHAAIEAIAQHHPTSQSAPSISQDASPQPQTAPSSPPQTKPAPSPPSRRSPNPLPGSTKPAPTTKPSFPSLPSTLERLTLSPEPLTPPSNPTQWLPPQGSLVWVTPTHDAFANSLCAALNSLSIQAHIAPLTPPETIPEELAGVIFPEPSPLYPDPSFLTQAQALLDACTDTIDAHSGLIATITRTGGLFGFGSSSVEINHHTVGIHGLSIHRDNRATRTLHLDCSTSADPLRITHALMGFEHGNIGVLPESFKRLEATPEPVWDCDSLRFDPSDHVLLLGDHSALLNPLAFTLCAHTQCTLLTTRNDSTPTPPNLSLHRATVPASSIETLRTTLTSFPPITGLIVAFHPNDPHPASLQALLTTLDTLRTTSLQACVFLSTTPTPTHQTSTLCASLQRIALNEQRQRPLARVLHITHPNAPNELTPHLLAELRQPNGPSLITFSHTEA